MSTTYIEKNTQTIWKKNESGSYECAFCDDALERCRGCGLADPYPELFGCCSTTVMCPNCISLKGPKHFHEDTIEIVVKNWDYKRHEFGEREFVSFVPPSESPESPE